MQKPLRLSNTRHWTCFSPPLYRGANLIAVACGSTFDMISHLYTRYLRQKRKRIKKKIRHLKSAKITDLNSKRKSYYKVFRSDMLMYVPLSAKRTLEFGCGTGSFSAEIKKRNGSDAWAVEINEESACAASKKLDQVICSDAANSIVQIPDDYFDCVIMLDILEHLHDPYQFLIQLKTKIRSDGLIVASIPNVRYYRHFIEYVFKGNWNYQDAGTLDKTHLRFFTYNTQVD